MKKKASSIHMGLSPEDAVVLNHLSTQAGTSPTNFARELVKGGLHTGTNEIVNKSTSIDEIVGAAIDIRIVKLENRIANLLIKSMTFSFEAKGIALNMMKQFGHAGAKVIIKANFFRGTQKANAHLKYIEHRQYDERSELFSQDKDSLDREWFTDKLGNYDVVHRIVISPP